MSQGRHARGKEANHWVGCQSRLLVSWLNNAVLIHPLACNMLNAKNHTQPKMLNSSYKNEIKLKNMDVKNIASADPQFLEPLRPGIAGLHIPACHAIIEVLGPFELGFRRDAVLRVDPGAYYRQEALQR